MAGFVTRRFLENILHTENVRDLNVSRDRIQDVKTGYVVWLWQVRMKCGILMRRVLERATRKTEGELLTSDKAGHREVGLECMKRL